MNQLIQDAKTRFLANLMSRKALCFFVGCFGTISIFIHGFVIQQAPSDIIMLVGGWTGAISSFASIWCVANHYDKKKS